MKHFIVAETFEAYSEYIQRNRLNARDTFYCESVERAARDVAVNQQQGIEAEIVLV